jgi:hypothetical protein
MSKYKFYVGQRVLVCPGNKARTILKDTHRFENNYYSMRHLTERYKYDWVNEIL